MKRQKKVTIFVFMLLFRNIMVKLSKSAGIALHRAIKYY